MAKAQRLIRTTPEAAFTYLSDLTRHNEWSGDSGMAVRQTSPGAVMVGATFERRGRQFGLRFEDEVKVVEFRPPEHLSFDAIGPKHTFRHSFDFEPAGDGTLLIKQQRGVPAPQGFSLTRPVLEFVRARRLSADLRRIARMLER